MTNEELDALWFRAMEASIRAGEEFTRYRFANLVAAVEREACAKLVWDTPKPDDEYVPHQDAIVKAIRARGGNA